MKDLSKTASESKLSSNQSVYNIYKSMMVYLNIQSTPYDRLVQIQNILPVSQRFKDQYKQQYILLDKMTKLDPQQRGSFDSILREICFIRTFYSQDLTKYTMQMIYSPCSQLFDIMDQQRIDCYNRILFRGKSRPVVYMINTNDGSNRVQSLTIDLYYSQCNE